MKDCISLLKPFVALSLMLLSGCVDDYEIPSEIADSYESEVVIEGQILSGEESTFYVSRTVPLTATDSEEQIKDARVRIIGQNGYESQWAEYVDGCYVIPTDELSAGTAYAVEVTVGTEVYQSAYQSLIETPEISSLTWEEQVGEVNVLVSTEGRDDTQRYFMWTYEEDWQFHVIKDINDFSQGLPLYDEDTYPDLEEGTYNPYYMCFNHAESGTILIYSTAELSENKVVNHELLSIASDEVKVSYLYSILVRQWALSEEAYEYYRLMKLYTEESGGLFTPMPNDVRGNVSCVSDETRGARGYVIASTVKEKRLFIDAADYQINKVGTVPGFYSSDKSSDNWQQQWGNWITFSGYVAYSRNGRLPDATVIYSAECVNCLLQEGATQERPSFWPEGY